MTPIIKVQDVHKSFGNLEVLKGIDFEVNSKEVVCLIGASGSGKSTMLRCINRLEEYSKGNIYFNGKNIVDESCNINEYRSKVGMVFQSFNLFNNMSVIKNCMIAQQKVLKIDKDEAYTRAMNYLTKVGMKDFANAASTTLSGGQKQRVAIARALANSPSIILADEPTGALDSQTSRSVMDLFHSLHLEQGKTIILITHSMELAKECPRVITLKDGHIISDESRDINYVN